ncbi:MAG: PaaI family thioesterase [Desulfotalea sp.]
MDIEKLNQFCEGSFVSHLGIKFYYEDEALMAKMPVNNVTRQPHGFLHGGATISLAESLASALSFLSVLKEQGEKPVFGYHVDASLLGSVRDGHVYAKAELQHQGRSSHIWDVRVASDDNKTVALCRVTVKVLQG